MNVRLLQMNANILAGFAVICWMISLTYWIIDTRNKEGVCDPNVKLMKRGFFWIGLLSGCAALLSRVVV